MKKPEFQNLSGILGIPQTPDFFETLLLLQLLLDHSKYLTGETSYTVPPCNKARISNFHLEFHEFQIFLKCYSFSFYLIILIFTSKSRYTVPPYNKAGISKFGLESLSSQFCYDFYNLLLIILIFVNHRSNKDEFLLLLAVVAIWIKTVNT